MFNRSDTLSTSDRQERDFDSSDYYKMVILEYLKLWYTSSCTYSKDFMGGGGLKQKFLYLNHADT